MPGTPLLSTLLILSCYLTHRRQSLIAKVRPAFFFSCSNMLFA
jgi:hypothetical protein